ncbi:hypothetical protein BOTBODRAFT_224301 [Botryobasidium botryosum FD-172 SS1]|uniref:F-box domain-containing protein n=1 Tax=Botryobasidium botryosum (strain FD-172 SS1) TaxID=930990 RepID=A0A067MND1_BOTB1|nr:hypothetical protein BOTBODRAFT_224301 [Botryobasidium botryosum FD-172 SS1]
MASNIQRIPTEILLQIFQIYKSQKCEDSTQHLFHLSLVCRPWRDFIQRCPALWSDMWLDVSTGKVEQQAAYQLERAGRTLLSLAIMFPWQHTVKERGEQGSAEPLPVRLANTLRNTMVRWESFRMHARPYEAQLFLDNCAGYTPNLSTIIIKSRYVDRNTFPPTLSIPFQRPVEAKRGPPITTSFRSILPVWSSLGTNVTEIQIDFTEVRLRAAQFVALLLSCPNLVQLTVTGAYDLTIDNISDPVLVPLPYLTDLRVSHIREPEYLIGVLRLQALQSLCIDEFEWSPAMGGILQNIFQTCNSLEKAEILPGDGGLEIYEDTFAQERIVLPSLKDLSLSAEATMYPLLQRLSLPQLISASFFDIDGPPPDSTRKITLPSLLSLELHGSTTFLHYVDAPNLVELDLVEETRSTGADPLRSLIEGPRPSLRSLWLDIRGLTDRDIIRCLELLPFLEELEICNCTVSDETLRALAKPPPSIWLAVIQKGLVPRLKSATFVCTHITDEGFATLVASRPAVDWKCID